MFVEDDGWEEEEEQQLVHVDNDEANVMSGVDSDHSKALLSYSAQLDALAPHLFQSLCN